MSRKKHRLLSADFVLEERALQTCFAFTGPLSFSAPFLLHQKYLIPRALNNSLHCKQNIDPY